MARPGRRRTGDGEGALKIGAQIIAVLTAIVRAIAAAFSYGLLWSAAAAIYLTLRQDVDSTEFDEVFLEDDDEEDDEELEDDEEGIEDEEWVEVEEEEDDWEEDDEDAGSS